RPAGAATARPVVDLPSGGRVPRPLLAPARARAPARGIPRGRGAIRRRAHALPSRPPLARQGRDLAPRRRIDAMTTESLRIAGGTVYDPANGVDGEVRDIW